MHFIIIIFKYKKNLFLCEILCIFIFVCILYFHEYACFQSCGNRTEVDISCLVQSLNSVYWGRVSQSIQTPPILTSLVIQVVLMGHLCFPHADITNNHNTSLVFTWVLRTQRLVPTVVQPGMYIPSQLPCL